MSSPDAGAAHSGDGLSRLRHTGHQQLEKILQHQVDQRLVTNICKDWSHKHTNTAQPHNSLWASSQFNLSKEEDSRTTSHQSRSTWAWAHVHETSNNNSWHLWRFRIFPTAPEDEVSLHAYISSDVYLCFSLFFSSLQHKLQIGMKTQSPQKACPRLIATVTLNKTLNPSCSRFTNTLWTVHCGKWKQMWNCSESDTFLWGNSIHTWSRLSPECMKLLTCSTTSSHNRPMACLKFAAATSQYEWSPWLRCSQSDITGSSSWMTEKMANPGPGGRSQS